ncbi:MAG: hypothetical protein K6L75_12580 [Cellvibrionaceae bacterium]
MINLSFCKVEIHPRNIVEIIPHPDVEIEKEMVDEFFSYLAENGVEGNISILLDKLTKFSYSFESLMILGAEERIKNVAVVSYDKLSIETSEYMIQRFNQSKKNSVVFTSREAAVDWLKTITL